MIQAVQQIAVLGEALIDLIVDDDGAYRPHLGGSPFNVAIGLARQGIDVSYLAPFSDDVFGERLRAALAAEGVRLPLERRSPMPTSLALVTLDEAGVPSYRLYREGVADKDTTFEEIRDNLPSDLRVFHTGSLAITPSQLPKIRRLFEVLRARNVQISIDINIRLRGSLKTDDYLAGVASLLGDADIVKASDEDLDALELSTDPREAAELAYGRMRSGLLLLTEGGGGALLYRGDDRIPAKAYPVANLVDTVGAGDTFHSAFLAALIHFGLLQLATDAMPHDALAAAVDFACAAAAINVTRAGCSPPTRVEVESFIESARG